MSNELSSNHIAQLIAVMTGGGFKRSATKADAIKRFDKVAAEKGVAITFDKLAGLDFDAATAKIQAAMAPAEFEAPASELAAQTIRPHHEVEASLSKIAGASRVAEAEIVPPAPKAKRERAPKAAKPVAEKAPTKREIMLNMVCTAEGATESEICDAIGWKACLVTLRRAAEAEKVTLRAEKQKGGRARYFGTRPTAA